MISLIQHFEVDFFHMSTAAGEANVCFISKSFKI